MTTSVGIDLGTTYSLVATLSRGQPRVLPNAVGELLTPSAVSVTETGTVVSGAAARARATTHPERTALAFKRDMGTPRHYELGGRPFTPEELSAIVLAELKRDAEAALGAEIDEAVVTVPAYFGDLQRRATRDACELAHLRVERIINEPTAAALAFGLNRHGKDVRAAVIDLGGGTFDVTVLEIIEGVIEIQGTAGDTRLGGEDAAELLAEHALSRLRNEQGIDVQAPTARARLREAAEQAKRRLSSEEHSKIVLAGLATDHGARDVELAIARDEFEDVIRPLLERMRGPILRALRDAQRKPDDIDEVLLVGGATRMPCVARFMTGFFGRLPTRTLPPDEAVALGAAVQAGVKAGDAAVADVVATDIAPFSLGVSTSHIVGDAVVTDIFVPIIERGTVLPASRVKLFSTLAHGQTEIHLGVYQGEHPQATQNQRIGECRVHGIPPGPPGEQSIGVRFTYDMNGVLDIDATVASTGKTASFTIEHGPGRLSRAALGEARKRLARLKFHPREALPNITALSRADALYVELKGHERSVLGAQIASFRGALESQEPEAIDAQREVLRALVASLARGERW